ncbi:MAG: DUF2127 domain-containing protein [Chthoniobacteraceae bacterium]
MVIEPNKPTFGLRLIAVVEVVKGFLAVVLAFGLHGLAGHHQNPLVHWIVQRFHLEDSAQAPHFIAEMLANPERFRIGIWTLFAVAYATLRFTEGYGLWLARRWGEWIALVSAAIYVPFEIYAIVSGPTLLKVTLLALNVALVVYLGIVLVKTRRKRAHAARVAAAGGKLETRAGGH